MTFPFEPALTKNLPIYGSEDTRFPVQNIYCVARNFADHAIEMGHDPEREAPFFFMKPSNSLLTDSDSFIYPSHSKDVHHEVEMVVALGRGGINITVEDAIEHIYGYGVGLDMTCRDVQTAAKKAGRPWEVAKAFVGSSPCSEIMPAEICGHPSDAGISLSINGEQRQVGNVNQMIWKTAELISELSKVFRLEAGDLIYTGTPAGVGPVHVGDNLDARLNEIAKLQVKVI